MKSCQRWYLDLSSSSAEAVEVAHSGYEAM